MFLRAHELLSHKHLFGEVATPFGSHEVIPPEGEQYILRMMIRNPNSVGFQIPPELEWLRNTIIKCDKIQQFWGVNNPFVYVTVRHGIVKSVTDDLWHVDGFSMRVPHNPEQNYIWTSNHGTEVLEQEVYLPEDFDPMVHNIHQYFQDVARKNVRKLREKRLYGIDPYVIHRRPTVPEGTHRTFFRISFVPIEIEDDTNTDNPVLSRGNKIYGRTDIRKRLTRYSL